MLEPFGHGFGYELVGDGFLGLVFVARLGREVVRDEHQAVLDVLPLYALFALVVLVSVFEVPVYLRQERLLRASAVLQPA